MQLKFRESKSNFAQVYIAAVWCSWNLNPASLLKLLYFATPQKWTMNPKHDFKCDIIYVIV